MLIKYISAVIFFLSTYYISSAFLSPCERNMFHFLSSSFGWSFGKHISSHHSVKYVILLHIREEMHLQYNSGDTISSFSVGQNVVWKMLCALQLQQPCAFAPTGESCPHRLLRQPSTPDSAVRVGAGMRAGACGEERDFAGSQPWTSSIHLHQHLHLPQPAMYCWVTPEKDHDDKSKTLLL